MYICAAPAVLHMFKKIKGKKDMNLELNVLGWEGDAKRKSEGENEHDCDQVMLYTCVKFSMNKLSKNCVKNNYIKKCYLETILIEIINIPTKSISSLLNL